MRGCFNGGMEQRRAYWDDTHLYGVDTEVIAVGDEPTPGIAVREGIVHPKGGGQPDDAVTVDGGPASVSKDDTAVWLHPEGDLPAVGDTITAILPKYDTTRAPTDAANEPYVRTCRVQALYMMMGRDLVSVQRVPAGNVFAIRGLDGVVLRNATLICGPEELRDVVNLAGVRRFATPMVRVALEPRSAAVVRAATGTETEICSRPDIAAT